MNTPQVSVLLPVRNGGTYLAEAVGSLLQQRDCELEILLVDDGSDDGAIDSLAGIDPRLRVLSNEGKGIVDALNTGWRHARAPILARMDADDLCRPGRLALQYQYLMQQADIAVLGCAVELISDHPIGDGYRRYQAWLDRQLSSGDLHRALLVECPLPHPTWMLRRSVMAALGGYRDAGWAEDYDFLLRADAAGYRFARLPQRLLAWRDHQQRLSRRHPRYSQQAFVDARAWYLEVHRLQGRAAVIWGAGSSGKALHDALRQRGVPVREFVEVHPRRIGGRVRNRPVRDFRHWRPVGDELLLVAVGVPAARENIRRHLLGLQMVEGSQFLFAA